MVLRKDIKDPYNWHTFFCWIPVKETIINADKSVTIVTYWLETIERRLIFNNMTKILRWDYRKAPDDDIGINAI